MGILGKPLGIFDLNNSDLSVGSFISIKDACEILSVEEDALESLMPFFKTVNGITVINENEIHISWNCNEIPNAPPSRIGTARISLDEYILKAVIRKVYPTAVIQQQVPWGRKKLDFVVTVNNETKIIEFHGPGHFTNLGHGFPESPFKRKEAAEKDFKNEYIIWPYWIQRCTSNVKAIFETDIAGFGALWSTEIHFGSFTFDQSAQIIDEITRRFNAVNDSGYGYFYIGQTRGRNNPQHPIIDKIKQGKKGIEIILPRGANDKNYWLPDILKSGT